MEHSVSVPDPALVSEAIVLWTGWGRKRRPSRDEAALVEHFGEPLALDLLPVLRVLEDDFYASTAHSTAPTLAEMGDQAAADFRWLHPEVSEDAVQALAWCYTFDFK
jgi:hypothetical protein